MYIWLRRCHLWLTFISIVLLISLSISGALLVFAKDIQHFFQSNHWRVAPQHPAMSPEDLINAIEIKTQNRIHTLHIEQAPHLAWQAQLDNNKYVSVNPYTGKILYLYEYDDTFYGFLVAWHRTLLASETQQPLTKNLVSIATLIFCINTLIGLWLWIKPKRRWRRLQFRRTSNRKAQLYQIHTIVGIYLILPMLLIAFTGMAFHWITPTQKIVEILTAQRIHQPTHPTATSEGTIDLTLALERAHAVLPAGTVHRIYFAKKIGDPVRLRLQMPGESHPYSWVWLEPGTAEIIDFYDASQQNLATQVWHFRYKFHIGEWWNNAIRSIWLLLALLPTLWAVTGVWMYCKRRRMKERARHPLKFKKPLAPQGPSRVIKP